MKRRVSGEVLLLIATIFNSFNLVMLVKANFGVSTLSSVPLTISYIFTDITIGTWTTIVQIIAMALMVIINRKAKVGYLFSFAVAFVYGISVDLFTYIFAGLPVTVAARIIYMIIGFVGTAIGSSMFMLCGLPILPYDLVVKEISVEKNASVKKVRTIYDIISLSISILLSFVFLQHFESIGFVTVIGVVFMGTLTGWFMNKLKNKIEVEQYTNFGKKLSQLT